MTALSAAEKSRYSAHRGVGKWYVWDNQERKRVGGWQDQLDAMLWASKLNDAERKREKRA